MLPRSVVPASSVDSLFGATHPSGGSSTVSLTEESSRGASLVNKPAHGWLHPDQKIADNGICYGVRYIGCLEVNTSMKSLDFDTRSLVAKECINRLCEAAGLKTADKKRKVDKRLAKMLSDKPNMDHAGTNVSLTVTSSYLNLVALETGEVIANHEMPNISFASGGDADTLDFVSYVAKDTRYGRACFVLECGGGLAEDVIVTIGQAFELRYKRYLKRAPNETAVSSSSLQASAQNGNMFLPLFDDPEYYNDLPGKVPPDIGSDTKLEDCSSTRKPTSQIHQTAVGKTDINQNLQLFPVTNNSVKNEVSDSLIDFAADLSNVCTYRKAEPEYVNTTAVIFNERLTAAAASAQSKSANVDLFDMQPLSCSLNKVSLGKSSNTTTPTTPSMGSSLFSNSSNANLSSVMDKVRASLVTELWFHGPISRKDSESLVLRDGDFLVRESQASPGQYVLTGMQNGQRKHLLLVDPEGVIRTKDKVFDSISHLIRYHMDNSLPIVSSESALLLKTPVCKLIPVGKSVQV